MLLYTSHLTHITYPSHTPIPCIYRRLVKRIYVPLPDPLARRALIKHLILKHHAAHHTSSSSSGPSSNKVSPDKTTNASTATTTSNTTVTKKNDKVMNKLTSLILGPDSRDSTTAVTSASSSPVPAVAEDGICGFSGADLTRIVELTEGYSGSDLSAVRACTCVHEGAICLCV